MEFGNDVKELGKTGVKIPSLGFGTGGIGGFPDPDYSKDELAINAIKTAINLGLWHIDTAEIYGKGHAEELIAKAIKDVDRESIFITSKVSGDNLEYDKVIRAAKASLKRLEVSHIDLYLVHWPNPKVPLSETMRAMEKLVEMGLVRFIGVSNFNVAQIEEARNSLSHEDIVNVQNKYNLLHREFEDNVIPYCQKENITFTAYTPLAKGKLANDDFLKGIGEKYGKTSVQVALNWIISQKNVIAITRSLNIEHIKENVGAMGWRMSDEDFRLISEKFR